MKNKKQEVKNKNQEMNKVLAEIVDKKKKDLVIQKKDIPLSKMKEFVVSLEQGGTQFIENIIKAREIALITEIKLASPSDPTLNPNVDIMSLAKEYERAGADAISYITEKYFFKGEVKKIIAVASAVNLPILQKDFVIDEYQIYEAKIVGSSALLLIARLVDGKTLIKYVLLCKKLGIEPIVEINDNKDLKIALMTSTSIIAVNARDLNTFEVDVEKACMLMKNIPDKYIKLGFSGIKSSKEIIKYKLAGAKGVLVGTSLVNSKNSAKFINKLKNI